jgi:hypothetical protein
MLPEKSRNISATICAPYRIVRLRIAECFSRRHPKYRSNVDEGPKSSIDKCGASFVRDSARLDDPQKHQQAGPLVRFKKLDATSSGKLERILLVHYMERRILFQEIRNAIANAGGITDSMLLRSTAVSRVLRERRRSPFVS